MHTVQCCCSVAAYTLDLVSVLALHSRSDSGNSSMVLESTEVNVVPFLLTRLFDLFIKVSMLVCQKHLVHQEDCASVLLSPRLRCYVYRATKEYEINAFK